MNTRLFWTKVDRTKGSCWIWTSAIDTHGYGHVSIGGKTHRSHRVAYEIFYGEIQKNMHVLHRCDNRLCVNPIHLFLGTNDDNVRDRVLKGRSRGAIGERNVKSKLTPSKVREIRMLHKNNIHTAIYLAEIHSVSVSTIHRAVTRETWNHID